MILNRAKLLKSSKTLLQKRLRKLLILFCSFYPKRCITISARFKILLTEYICSNSSLKKRKGYAVSDRRRMKTGT